MAVAETVIVELGAETQQYLNKVREAERTFDGAMSGIERSGQRTAGLMTGVFQGIGQELAKFVGNSIQRLGSIASELAKLPGVAARAAVSLKDLQEIQFAGRQSGMTDQQVNTGLEGLAKELNEARREETELGKLFAANNIQLKDRHGQVLGTNEALRHVADLMRNAATEQDRIKIAEMAGLSREWVDTLRNGATEFGNLRNRASELGVVLSDEVINKAKEFDLAWKQAWDVWSAEGKAALIDVGTAMGFLAEKAIEFIKGIRAQAREAVTQGPVNEGIVAEGSNPNAAPYRGDQNPNFMHPNTQQPPAPRSDPRGRGGAGTGTGGRTIIPPSSSGSSAKDREDAYERLNRRIEERVALMNAETAVQASLNPLVNDYGYAVAKAKTEQELLNAAKKENITITPEVRANITRLAESYALATVAAGKLAEEQQKIRKNAEEFNSLGKDVTKGFISDLLRGKSAAEAFAGALQKIGDKLIDLALDGLFNSKGGGLFGNLFGSGGFLSNLFGGFRAGGGGTQAGKTYVVGENGPELFRSNQSGTIIPNVPAISSGSTGSNGGVSLQINIDASGADVAAIARLDATVDRLKRELPATIIGTVRQGDKRRMFA